MDNQEATQPLEETPVQQEEVIEEAQEVAAGVDRSAFNCPDCSGEGLQDEKTLCPKCNGKGKVA